MVKGSTYYPYRSEAARDSCFSYLDSMAATNWPAGGEERTVLTSFGPTFVRVNGPEAAPPVVLLHGAASNSLMWAPNIEALSAGHRTFAVDQISDFWQEPLRQVSVVSQRFSCMAE
jgi:pimeloyl-ACP methyl ester carboxylesterase